MVNWVGIIYLKSGTLARSTFTLSSFFGLPSGSLLSDPQIIFDAMSGRWFASIVDLSNNRVAFAASTSNDPTGTWKLYFATPTNGAFPDQPFIGASDDKFVISGNDFQGCCTNIGAQYWIFNKADLVAGAASPRSWTNAPDAGVLSIHPAQHLGASSGAFYMVSISGTTGRLFTVSGVPGISTVTVTLNYFTLNPLNPPPNAVQPGTATLVTNDNRVLSAVWEFNTLWFASNDRCVPNGDTAYRSCARLVQLTTAGTSPPTRVQDFDYGASGEYYFYPAVSLYHGHLVVVYGRSSATVYPSLLVTGRTPGDPTGALQAPIAIRSGTVSDASTRYGDFFGAATDPSPTSASTFWIAGEYRVDAASWSTAVAQIGLAPGTLSGTVTASQTGAAIAGASVVASSTTRSYTATSGATGAYTISGMIPDIYAVTATGPCTYQPSTGTATILSDQTTTFNLVLSLYPLAALTGYVYGGSTSNPLSGAVVTNTCSGLSTTTSSTGQYSLWIQGNRPVTAPAAGPCKYQTSSVTVNVPDGTTKTYNFVLPAWPLGTLSGYVTDSGIGGPGIADATVRDSCSGASTTTDSTGYYSFSVVSGKSITVTATATGYNGNSVQVTVPSGGSATLSIALTPHTPGGGGCHTPPCPTSVTLSATNAGSGPFSVETTGWQSFAVAGLLIFSPAIRRTKGPTQP